MTSPETLVVVLLSQENTGFPGLGASTSDKGKREQFRCLIIQLHIHVCTKTAYLRNEGHPAIECQKQKPAAWIKFL